MKESVGACRCSASAKMHHNGTHSAHRTVQEGPGPGATEAVRTSFDPNVRRRRRSAPPRFRSGVHDDSALASARRDLTAARSHVRGFSAALGAVQHLRVHNQPVTGCDSTLLLLRGMGAWART
jgi:hypothetical protein